ncbi:hypothetical protein AB182_03910 [Phytobacter ursingii]|uniref:Uncharacterized protein n=1 Tax=Phytobacter ursingii TaxID=1972431 RepID=A0AAC8QKL6_9ENTR|nr:hypothetical protein AB182_03910 [Phytobacter ursingii]
MQCTKAITYMIPYIQPLQIISPVGGKTTSGDSGDFIRVVSVSEAYQDDNVPKGSEAEPLAELAYGLQVP